MVAVIFATFSPDIASSSLITQRIRAIAGAGGEDTSSPPLQHMYAILVHYHFITSFIAILSPAAAYASPLPPPLRRRRLRRLMTPLPIESDEMAEPARLPPPPPPLTPPFRRRRRQYDYCRHYAAADADCASSLCHAAVILRAAATPR